ncbi:MAG: hypothetical protein PVF97_00945 [Desulfobacterales bacterium]
MEAILALARRLEQNLPNGTRGAVRKMTTSLMAVADQVGDDLVPVDSARLAGVPLQTVPGHASVDHPQPDRCMPTGAAGRAPDRGTAWGGATGRVKREVERSGIQEFDDVKDRSV